MNPLVTVITPTTGAASLQQAMQSVAAQTYTNVQHLVVVDGTEHAPKVRDIVNAQPGSAVDIINLPYPTGRDRFNGHRIYGAMSYIARGDYLCFLDEDNWYEPEHIEMLIQAVPRGGWAYAVRKIVDATGTYVCNDDCESLGMWQSCLGDYFVDVNCYFLPRMLAVGLSPVGHRRARQPGVPEVDRALMQLLRDRRIACAGSGVYTVNYRAANTALSVKADFFLRGNRVMQQRYGNTPPWRRAREPASLAQEGQANTDCASSPYISGPATTPPARRSNP